MSAAKRGSPWEQESPAELRRGHQPGDGQALPEPPRLFAHAHTRRLTCHGCRHTSSGANSTQAPTFSLRTKSCRSVLSAADTSGDGGDGPCPWDSSGALPQALSPGYGTNGPSCIPRCLRVPFHRSKGAQRRFQTEPVVGHQKKKIKIPKPKNPSSSQSCSDTENEVIIIWGFQTDPDSGYGQADAVFHLRNLFS